MKSHDIKDILEERRVEVSQNSWEKLASQLDANDQKQKRRRFYFPYAACLALIFSLIVFMFIKNDGNSDEKSIADTEQTIKQNDNTTTPMVLKEEINDEVFKEALVNVEKTKNPKEKDIIKEGEASPKVISNQQKEQLKVGFQKEIKNAIVIAKEDSLPKEIETIIAKKEVIIDPNSTLKASIVALSASEKVTITDEEIDQLLKEAQQSLSELETKKEVDITRFATADELLNEVEYELDKSFKQKVFELIKHNVQKRRTVVLDN